MKVYTTRCFILMTFFLLGGCGFHSLVSQKDVRISEHSAFDTTGADVLSYPATLRASVMAFSRDALTSEQQKQWFKLKLREKISGRAYKRCLDKGYECSRERSALDYDADAVFLFEKYARKKRIRVLAEPPPDVAAAVNLSVNAGVSDSVEVGLGLGEKLLQTQLSTESDAKRYLAYRLSEALFNYPEKIAPIYGDLMKELINYSAPVPAKIYINGPADQDGQKKGGVDLSGLPTLGGLLGSYGSLNLGTVRDLTETLSIDVSEQVKSIIDDPSLPDDMIVDEALKRLPVSR